MQLGHCRRADMRDETWIDAEGRQLRSDDVPDGMNDGGAMRRSLIIWRGWSWIRPSGAATLVTFSPRSLTRAGRASLRRAVLEIDGPFAIEVAGSGAGAPARFLDDPVEAIYYIEDVVASTHEAQETIRPTAGFRIPNAPMTDARATARRWLGRDVATPPAEDGLVATPLPFARLGDLRLPALQMALDSWNALGGVWNNSLAYMLEDHEVAHHASMVYRDDENRLRFAWQGSSVRRYGSAQNLPLQIVVLGEIV